jgi:hypothetical protein
VQRRAFQIKQEQAPGTGSGIPPNLRSISPVVWDETVPERGLVQTLNKHPFSGHFSKAAAHWYAHEKRELVASAWCVPEFAGALGIKQRTGAIDAQQAQGAWERFERRVAADLQLLPVAPENFRRAAALVLDATAFGRDGFRLKPDG